MKSITIILLAVIICLSVANPVMAAEPMYDTTCCEEASEVSRTMETQWYYRVIDGVTYQRLWSITDGVWLTDWIPVT